MQILLVFGFFMVITTAHKITDIEVPTYDEPHQEFNLTCHFKLMPDDPPVYFVRWYVGSDEIFSFNPGRQPQIQTFNHTAGGVSKGTCNLTSCTITVIQPEHCNTMHSFTCEVIAERSFITVRQLKVFTTAVTLKENPEILVLPTHRLGDVLFNCTTQPAKPPAYIEWFIYGAIIEGLVYMVNSTQVSEANEFGLQSSWRSLGLRMPSTPSNISMVIRCEATQSTFPPYTRSSNRTLNIVRQP